METVAAEQNPVLEKATVVARRILCEDTTVLTLEAPLVASRPRPGQFVMLVPPATGSDPFLPRPYSVHRLAGPERLEILIQAVGRASALLTALEPGGQLELFGPLGRGFAVPPGCRAVLGVGGGAGVAPLVFLAEQQAQVGRRVVLFYGAAAACRLGEFPQLEATGVDLVRVTEDGSSGRRGLVTEVLEHHLGAVLDAGPHFLAACGPRPMLEKCAALAREKNLACQVSLESRMACGVGACLGCSEKGGGGRLLRVCCEGPVFDAGEVFGT